MGARAEMIRSHAVLWVRPAAARRREGVPSMPRLRVGGIGREIVSGLILLFTVFIAGAFLAAIR